MDKDNKLIIIISVVTIAIIGLGIYFLTKPAKIVDQITPSVTNQDVLIKNDSYKIQAKDEKVTLVEFGDFQCPACADYYPIIERLLEEYKDNLSFVARHFPLLQHQNAKPSAYAAEAAGRQGKFWEMYALLYKNQAEWSDQKNPEEIFVRYAESLKLDKVTFVSDMKLDEVISKVNSDYADGVALKVNSTPSFFLNGQKISLPGGYESLKILIDNAIKNSIVENQEEERYHVHFALKVYINGKAVDFTLPKYQEGKDNKLDPNIHFHNGNGEIVHVHKKDIKLGRLFESFGMETPNLVIINGVRQNGNDLFSYIPKDLDKILVTDESTIQSVIAYQISSVSNDSCIYSETCPERGTPPAEECIGGVGTDCEEE